MRPWGILVNEDNGFSFRVLVGQHLYQPDCRTVQLLPKSCGYLLLPYEELAPGICSNLHRRKSSALLLTASVGFGPVALLRKSIGTCSAPLRLQNKPLGLPEATPTT